MASWFQRNDVNNEGTGNTPPPLEVSDDVIKKIADDVTKRLETSQNASVETALANNPILKRLNDSLDATETARQQRQAQQAQQATNTQQTEFDTAWSELEPAAQRVISDRFNQANERTLRVEAREVRRSVFEDVDSFEYYTGDIKRQVDEMLDREPLTSQANANVVRNAYKVVLADHIKELQEKKLRSRLSAASGSSQASGLSVPDPAALPGLTLEEKNYADKMGVTHEEWAKSKKALMEAGEVAGV